MVSPPAVSPRTWITRVAQTLRPRRRGSTGRWVGLDVGSQSMKLVELERTARGPRLLNLLIQELPVAPDGQVIDRTGWLQTALKEFEARDIHVTLTGPQVALRRVPMPLMSARELQEAVKWQIKDQLPFPVQEAVIDFHVLGEVWEKDIKKQDLLVAAAPAAVLHDLTTLVERSGVRMASATPTAAALWSCVAALMPEARQGSIAVIDVGAQMTHVVIAKDGCVRVARDLTIGSDSITRALVGVVAAERGQITIDVSTAESLKRRYGILTDTAEGQTEEGVPVFHMASLMRPVLEHLLTELSRFLDFYKVQMEAGGVSRILLCGGGANLKSLHTFLADGLGVSVELFNPLLRLQDRVQPLESEQIADGGPRLVAALGAALEHGRQLNLLPKASHAAQATTQADWLVRVGLSAAGALALALFLILRTMSAAVQAQIHGQQLAWARVEPAYTQYMHATATVRGLHRTIGAVEGFLDHQPVWEGLFKELSSLLPVSIELDEFTAVVGQVGAGVPATFRMKGHAFAGDVSAEAAVAQFVTAMSASPFFQRVELRSSETHTGEARTASFELEGMLR